MTRELHTAIHHLRTIDPGVSGVEVGEAAGMSPAWGRQWIKKPVQPERWYRTRTYATDARAEHTLRDYYAARGYAWPGEPQEAPSTPQEAPEPDGGVDPPRPIRTLTETLTATDAPVRNQRASNESTPREIALFCRDYVRSGLMTAEHIRDRFGASAVQAEQIVAAIQMGLLDGEQASEAEPDPYTNNADPGEPVIKGVETVLIIGDLHEPFTHEDYFDFVCRVRDEYTPDLVVQIGDEADNNALSYHEKDPDGLSPGHEARFTQQRLERWMREFPEMKLIVGNHSALPFRKAFSSGLPKKYLKTYEEIWEAPPGWQWVISLEVDGVRYIHGDGRGGKTPAYNWATQLRQNVVCGHVHTVGGVHFSASYHDLIWGLDVGCGIDQHAYAMRYAKKHGKRPVLGCGVVKHYGKRPEFIPMTNAYGKAA